MARRNKREERDVALARIARLVALAEQALAAERPDRVARYCELAWAVKTTYQLRGTAIDGRRCRRCGAFFSSRTVRVRVRDGVRVTTCLACGSIRRRPLAPRPSARTLARPAEPGEGGRAGAR
ncbi:MAG TPA: hypothetical protein VM370_13230 [Candidatus Thermoplasmatota archaeon]|nr:hypothetical protein [Candidatus Thermoplasmatota archaeon]